ncbi:hypothetical protein [Streptomyces sp. NPDC003688]
MPSMTAAPTLEDRPPLPIRPKPHERDGRQDSPDTGGRPHPQQATDRARLAAEIGPRRPGAIYTNVDGRFEVLAVTTDPSEARLLLRRSARWAVTVRDTLRPDGQPFPVGSVWTESDYLNHPAPVAGATLAN